jgi:hypothetical protein
MTKKFFRAVSAVAFAGLMAGTVTVLPSFSEQVAASTTIETAKGAAVPLRDIKGDRLDARPLGSACSEQAWPYFEAGCLRDQRAAQGRAKSVRIISADRIVR